MKLILSLFNALAIMGILLLHCCEKIFFKLHLVHVWTKTVMSVSQQNI